MSFYIVTWSYYGPKWCHGWLTTLGYECFVCVLCWSCMEDDHILVDLLVVDAGGGE